MITKSSIVVESNTKMQFAFHAIHPQDEIASLEVPTYLINTVELSQRQQEDESIKQITEAIRSPDDPTVSIGLARRAKNFCIDQGVLFRKNATGIGRDKLLVIPS